MTLADPENALIGRERESSALTGLIDAAKEERGGAIVVSGAPGIGKTSLLKAARAHASKLGFEILTATGVQSETHLPFAGLHQLLRPVLRDIDRLPASYGSALQGAFGLNDAVVTSPFLVAMSTLHLLGESAERAPLLLLIDDAQWLDRSTTDALAFIARRVESDPTALIASLREGFESPFLEAGVATLTVDALTEANAEALLNAHSPALARSLRDRVLRNAAGNPLALVELSTAFRSSAADRAFGSSDLPLTVRLERAFADRLSSMSPEGRSFLPVAAASE